MLNTLLKTRIDVATAFALAIGLVATAHGSHFLLEHPDAAIAASWVPLVFGVLVLGFCAGRIGIEVRRGVDAQRVVEVSPGDAAGSDTKAVDRKKRSR